MKITKLKNYLIVTAILCIGVLNAQVLTGTIVDEYGPVRRVKITIKGKTIITYTDRKGRYILSKLTVNDTIIYNHPRGASGFRVYTGQKTIDGYLKRTVGCGMALPSLDTPQFDPWPPPLPSAKIEIPRSAFSSCKYLGDVNELLIKALFENGYDDMAYFLVPAKYKNGFAVTTQLEQIDEEGIAKRDPNRWNSEMIDNKFSFTEYVEAFLFPNAGYFRVIVFVVTDIPLKPTKMKINRKTAMSWLDDGAIGFPSVLKSVNFTEDHKVIALIYEYELIENEAVARQKKPSRHTGKDHLMKSQIWKELVKE